MFGCKQSVVFITEAQRVYCEGRIKSLNETQRLINLLVFTVTVKPYHFPGPLDLSFSTAGPRPGTGPWHQLYRAARGSPGICRFSFLSNFH